jgi:SAM-dependent methyltransferase
MKKDYLSVVYNEERTPKTEYPGELARYLARRFTLKPGDRLLEIGCGRGDFLRAFQELGLVCSGVDVEERSTQSLPEFDVRLCDLSKQALPFPDESFDVVYHKSLIEHMDDPANLMTETYRVLKSGGKVIILTPDWVSQMRNFYEDITHRRPYDITALQDTLTMFGFTETAVEKFRQLPIVWKARALKPVAGLLRIFLNVHSARYLTKKTNVKFFRWSVELMVLGYGVK